MRYHNSDFAHENAFLRSQPESAQEAYNKLVCLVEWEKLWRDVGMFTTQKLSKRRNRLVKTYWAFRGKEARV